METYSLYTCPLTTQCEILPVLYYTFHTNRRI